MTCPRCHNAELDPDRFCFFCGLTVRTRELARAPHYIDERVVRYGERLWVFAEREA